MSKLRFSYNGVNVLTVKMKPPSKRYHEADGELDIIIDAAKRELFDDVYLQTKYGKMLFPISLNAVSWHGFYYKQNGELKLPLLNFKNEGENRSKRKIISVRHCGTVNQKDVFAFPICSLYIPRNIDYRISKGSTAEGNMRGTINIEKKSSNVRLDLFVLPKGVTGEEFISEYKISFNYLMFDITMFDRTRNGELLPIQGESKICTVSIGDHHALIRIIYNNLFQEYEFNNKYGLLIHEPNNTIEMLLNRLIGYEDEGKIKTHLFREIHNRNVDEVKKENIIKKNNQII